MPTWSLILPAHFQPASGAGVPARLAVDPAPAAAHPTGHACLRFHVTAPKTKAGACDCNGFVTAVGKTRQR